MKIQEYFLGKWDSEKQKVLAENILKAEENNEKLKYKKIEGMNLPYVEIVMDDGNILKIKIYLLHFMFIYFVIFI